MLEFSIITITAFVSMLDTTLILIMKNFCKGDFKRFIPIFSIIFGIGLGIAGYYTKNVEMGNNLIEAIFIGLSAGAAATGIDQVSKQLSKNDETAKTAEYLKNFLSTSENEKDKNVTDLEAYKKDKALEQIKATLVAYAIAEAENLKVTDKEIEKEITTAASSGGYSDSKSYTDYYTQSVGMDVKELIKESLLDDKAVQFLAKNAKVVEPKKDKK